jgi:hypothetical protein
LRLLRQLLIRSGVFDDVKEVRRGNLYDLYGLILNRVIPEDTSEEFILGCRSVLGFLTVALLPQTISTIITLLRQEETFNVLHFFRRISSIITSGLQAVNEKTIPRPHKSFVDYLVSDHVDPRLYISKADIHSPLSVSCYKIMESTLHFNMVDHFTSAWFPTFWYYNPHSNKQSMERREKRNCLSNLPFHPGSWLTEEAWVDEQIEERLSPALIYSCDSFLYHLFGTNPTPSLIEICRQFLFEHFLFWLEVVILLHRSDCHDHHYTLLRLSERFREAVSVILM